jgi:acyl dehydratase
MDDDPLYLEDLPLGETMALGSHEFTAAGIEEFATQWDPLPIHVAAEPPGPFDAPIASGFHTLCVTTRLAVEGYRRGMALVAGLGVDDLRWPTPVRPGDELSVEAEFVDRRPSETRPDAGVVREVVRGTVDGETAIRYDGASLVRRESGANGA